ncbi:hypothetical protein Acr_18g0007790 [Actinidia rufa]|uniref:Uncharacterized protein n=1 Tax=Actinidia rufa TaxID=165716 RepID=A0A7J0G761_9ERIC|nr:hypothetical protein Acr_18g0007790 [Actinidia rufa]
MAYNHSIALFKMTSFNYLENSSRSKFMASKGYHQNDKIASFRQFAVSYIEEISRCEQFDAFVPYLAMKPLSRDEVPENLRDLCLIPFVCYENGGKSHRRAQSAGCSSHRYGAPTPNRVGNRVRTCPHALLEHRRVRSVSATRPGRSHALTPARGRTHAPAHARRGSPVVGCRALGEKSYGGAGSEAVRKDNLKTSNYPPVDWRGRLLSPAHLDESKPTWMSPSPVAKPKPDWSSYGVSM